MAEKFSLAAYLAPVSESDTTGREQIEYIDIIHIHPDERNFYSLDGVKELAANIEFAGLQQPIRVRSDPEQEGDYIVVSGHRRRAALELLVKDGKAELAQVPCIVERSSAGAADEVEAMLQELRLIYANSDTRRMSSADVSKQAERVEMLLYELKEAGVDFPGRMRDHVAEACKVSASKLARLKVIRENLGANLKAKWESGAMSESVAYELARHSPEVQRFTIKLITHDGTVNKDCKYWNESRVKYEADKIERELKPRKGPKGSCESCDATGQRLDRITTCSRWDDHCSDGKCCHCCPNIGTCGFVCSHLSGEVEKAKAAAKAKRAGEKAERDKQNKDICAPTVRLWKRFGEARVAAGLTFEQYARKAGVGAFRREKKVADFEQGLKITPSSGGLPYAGGDGVDEWRIRPLIRAANALGCSIDYLLCQTDEPRKAQELKKAVLDWRSRGETPPEGKIIITYGFTNDGPKYTPAVWDGYRFHAPGNPKKELTGLAQQFTRWTLLPEEK